MSRDQRYIALGKAGASPDAAPNPEGPSRAGPFHDALRKALGSLAKYNRYRGQQQERVPIDRSRRHQT
jgi:hypothetical protein